QVAPLAASVRLRASGPRREGGRFESMAGPTQLPALASDPQFRQAWRALRGDGAVQFDLTPAAPPPHAPDWLRTLGRWIGEALRPIGRAIDWITSLMPEAPYARILLWAVL